VSRRTLLLLPAALTALALPVSPALAGEDDDPATLNESRGCVNESSAKVTVSGDDIDAVVFSVDGRVRKTVTSPTNRGTFVFSMRCSRLSVGAHRARAVVTFEEGSTDTLRFQITRSRQGSPRFTG
jgi:hypothetical protein